MSEWKIEYFTREDGVLGITPVKGVDPIGLLFIVNNTVANKIVELMKEDKIKADDISIALKIYTNVPNIEVDVKGKKKGEIVRSALSEDISSIPVQKEAAILALSAKIVAKRDNEVAYVQSCPECGLVLYCVTSNSKETVFTQCDHAFMTDKGIIMLNSAGNTMSKIIHISSENTDPMVDLPAIVYGLVMKYYSSTGLDGSMLSLISRYVDKKLVDKVIPKIEDRCIPINALNNKYLVIIDRLVAGVVISVYKEVEVINGR